MLLDMPLGEINSQYVLEVYSNEKDKQIYSVFDENPNVKYMGSVPYAQVQERMAESDITIIVEGFKEEDINLWRVFIIYKSSRCIG